MDWYIIIIAVMVGYFIGSISMARLVATNFCSR